MGSLHSSTKIISSPDILFSATDPANPRSSKDRSSMLETTVAPVARASFSMSDFLTLCNCHDSCFGQVVLCQVIDSFLTEEYSWHQNQRFCRPCPDHLFFLFNEGLHLGRVSELDFSVISVSLTSMALFNSAILSVFYFFRHSRVYWFFVNY